MSGSTMVVIGLMLLAPATLGAQDGIERLAWLGGCWSGGAGGRQVDEQWMKPAGGTMLGMSRTVARGRTIESEFLQVRQDADGISYIAKPSNQPEAAFRLVSADAAHARFENPAHDFPQRIIYTLNPDGSLRARIEGSVNGQERAVDYQMKRSICP
ncbi:MAG: DUF6265 family protein [Acidobacteria bacterium]|nr:DUF6265 family protein [Acidobacteriota bacterium]